MYDVERFRKQARQIAREQGYTNPCSEVTSVTRHAPIAVKTLAQGYIDAQRGVDNSGQVAIRTSLKTGVFVASSVMSASTAGAGTLAGYAGMAHAVSTVGLGGATTAIAGTLGSSATGAAATAVVTAFVGGPLVMTAILAGGTGAAAYGLYKIGRWFVTL